MRTDLAPGSTLDSLSESDDAAPGLGGVLDFMRLVWALDHGLQMASKRMQNRLGVTGPQRLVIRIVGRFPGIRPKRLAEILHVHPSTLTGVLRRLQQRGLLARTTDPGDGRQVLLSLTSVGRGLNKTRGETVEAKVSAALSRQPEARIEGTRMLLAALIDELARR